MKIIGLTGGIGSGKSTVARVLAELGAVIVDLDKVGHDVLKQKEAREKLVMEFGESILNNGGDIDRARLGGIVFNDSKALSRLNRIVHPVIDDVVKRKVAEYLREGVEVVVLEAAAMLDAGRSSQVDEVWVTIAPESVVLERLAGRTGYSEAEAKARIKSQMTGEERVKQADVVIDTDCTLDELKTRVTAEWNRLRKRL
jgi:dephospho-CoA kinase